MLALAAIATFDKNTLARAIEEQGSAHAQQRLFSSEDEVGKVHAAAAGVGNSSVPPQPTIFTKILNKEIPADIVYEDDKVISYHLPPNHPKSCVSIPKVGCGFTQGVVTYMSCVKAFATGIKIESSNQNPFGGPIKGSMHGVTCRVLYTWQLLERAMVDSRWVGGLPCLPK